MHGEIVFQGLPPGQLSPERSSQDVDPVEDRGVERQSVAGPDIALDPGGTKPAILSTETHDHRVLNIRPLGTQDMPTII